MRRRTLVVVAGAVTLAAGSGVAVAGAVGDDDAADTPLTGSALERASTAALAHTGGGRVTATEDGDEDGRYEVEVTRAGGDQVDVHLDEDFRVIGDEADHEPEGE